MTELTHALLSDYADSFCTYGHLSNPIWFLGLEEGGGRSLEDASRKIIRWDEMGRRTSVDLTDPGMDDEHRTSGFLRKEGKPAVLQTTWSNQLRVLLGMNGEPLDNDRIRHLQTSVHGQLAGPTCLMELLPLPCRNASDWVYGDVPFAPAANEPNVFATKKAYRAHYLPQRLDTIALLVKENRPSALVCTSWTHWHHIGPLLDDLEAPDFKIANVRRQARIGRLHDTVVAVCSHPAHQVAGPRNAFYHALGQAIAERIPGNGGFKRAA